MSNFSITESISKAVSVKITCLLKNQRFVNSYLFAGNNSGSKLNAAKYLAMYLNCVNDNKPCLECKNCKSIQDDQFYGFLKIERKEKAESIKVEEIRDIRKIVSQGSYKGWLVVYVKEAHKLTVGASNSFLKILEEPPANVLFVLEVPTPYLMIETIRSRSQTVYFPFQTNADFSDEIFKDISVDDLYRVIKTSDKNELMLIGERSRIDRNDLKQKLSSFIEFCFFKYRDTGDNCFIELIKVGRKYVKFLERPVNATTSCFLLLLEMKKVTEDEL